LAPLDFAVLPLTDVPGIGEHGARPREDATSPLAMRRAFRERFIAPLPALVRSLQTAVAAWRPDVLVNDPVSFATTIVAEQEGLPYATLNNVVFSWPGRDVAPYGLGLPPATSQAQRDEYAALHAAGEQFFAPVVVALNDVRASCGLPPRCGPLPVATLSPYLQLLPTVPGFDYAREDVPAQVHYTGACLWDPPAALAPATAAWLAARPPHRPLVLVAASGAFSGTARLVQAALDAFAAPDAGCAVLATLPFDHPLHATPPPPHLHLTRFAPHSHLLPHAAVVVTHGGFGMASKALAQGCPLVVVPWAADQPEVAARVVWAGAGCRLEARTLTPERLRAAVREVLATPRYRAGAQRLAGLLAAPEGPAVAARLLTRLAATGQPVLRSMLSPGDAAAAAAVSVLGSA
jgi:UDP:flavonoid glycosyltransferase YjiC (YdhE family)